MDLFHRHTGSIHIALFHKLASALILTLPAHASAMAINEHRNKPFGPGGGTRRLHLSS